MQTYTSEVLYHMVGSSSPQDDDRNFQTLCKVLESMEIRHRKIDGLSSPIAVKIDYSADLDNGEPIVQTVTCFCDIHRDQLHPIHTGKYGWFGVGVSKEFVAQCGGRPVIYIPIVPKWPGSLNNYLRNEIMNAHRALDCYLDPGHKTGRSGSRALGAFPTSANEAISLIEATLGKNVLAYLKLFDVTLADNDPKNYYMEREWRIFGNLNLEFSLREIVVGKGYSKRLKEKFPKYAGMLKEIPL